MEEIC